VPTFPDGLDVEAIAFAALRTAMEEARPGAEREHVTLHIYRHPERFRIGDYRRETDLSHLRWTVDEPEDFALVTTIYEALYPGNPAFSTEDILELLEANPHLKQANVHIRRNEGLERSEATDRARG